MHITSFLCLPTKSNPRTHTASALKVSSEAIFMAVAFGPYSPYFVHSVIPVIIHTK